MNEPSFPKRAILEEPLLRALIKLGGEIDFATQGRDLEIMLAREFKLSDEARDFVSLNYNSKDHNKWRNHLQFVRDDLVKKSDLFQEPRGKWGVTDAGYRRVGMQRPAKR